MWTIKTMSKWTLNKNNHFSACGLWFCRVFRAVTCYVVTEYETAQIKDWKTQWKNKQTKKKLFNKNTFLHCNNFYVGFLLLLFLLLLLLIICRESGILYVLYYYDRNATKISEQNNIIWYFRCWKGK